MKTKLKILISGCGGFLGRSLAASLVNKGHKITAIDNNFRGNLKSITKNKNITLKKIDILNYDKLEKAFTNFDIVFHLAAINGTENFYKIPNKVIEIGIIGTYNIVKLCKKYSVPKLIYASSSEVYHEPKIFPTDEKIEVKIPDISNPRFSYSGSKIASELIIINLLRNSKTKYLIFRPHNIIGPNMGFEHVIPQIVKKIHTEHKKSKTKNLIKIKIQGYG